MTQEAFVQTEGSLLAGIRRWISIVVEFVFAQGFAQFAGMICGLIFVRWIPVEQYALYALCMTSLSLATVGSDLGLNGSLSYFWRQNLAQQHPIAPKVAAVRKLRSALLVASLIASIAVLAFSPVAWSAPRREVALCVALIAGAAWLQVSNGIGLTLLRLDARQRQSYLCEVSANIVRLLGAGLLVATGLAAAWFALAIGVIGAATCAFTIRIVNREAPTHEGNTSISAHDWREIRAYMLPVAPSVLVYMVQDPLVYWFTAQRTGTTAVAEVFALSRIGAILALSGSFTYIVLLPRLARIRDSKIYLQTLAIYIACLAWIALVVVGFIDFVPSLPLLLIGPRYAHLQHEVVVSVAAVSVTVLSSMVVLANRVRGWVALDPMIAIAQLLLVVGLCVCWDYTSTFDVVSLSLVLASTALACAALTTCLGLARPSLVTAAAGASQPSDA